MNFFIKGKCDQCGSIYIKSKSIWWRRFCGDYCRNKFNKIKNTKKGYFIEYQKKNRLKLNKKARAYRKKHHKKARAYRKKHRIEIKRYDLRYYLKNCEWILEKQKANRIRKNL